MKKTHTNLRTLPIEIFDQHIFVNLPVRSLLRFKAVCKQWNDLIKDPNFVRMHLDHAKQQQNNKLLIYSHVKHEYYSLDHQNIRSINGGDCIRDYIRAVKLHYPIHDSPLPVPIFVRLAGSVDGLVCISCEADWDKSVVIFVWNPTTRAHKMLPPHPDVLVKGNHGIGFGYDSDVDDYNVVRVVSGSRIDIYSLKTNSWKLFMSGEGIPHHLNKIQSSFRICYVDGSFFWLACHKSPQCVIHFIACFDLKQVDDEEEKKRKLIREIPVPDNFRVRPGFSELMVMGGCLSLFKVGNYFTSLKMWSMMKINETKNDGAEYMWVNRYDGVPICLSKDGKIVLRIADKTPTELVLYDTDTKSFQDLCPIHWISERGTSTEDKVTIEESQMYIESLVSPNFIS